MASTNKLSILNGGQRQYASSIYSTIEPSFKRNKNELAIIAAHQSREHLSSVVGDAENRKQQDDLDCLAWTYQQFHRGALRFTTALRSADIQHGSTMMTLLPNCAEFWLCYLTTFIQKLNITPIDIGTLLKPREAQLQHFLRLLQPKVVIISDAEGAKAVDAAANVVGLKISVKLTTDLDRQGPINAEWKTLEAFIGTSDERDEESILSAARDDDHNRTAFTIFTSGTSSGRPKGCPRSVLSVIHSSNSVQRSWTEKPGRCLSDTANFRAIALVVSTTAWTEGSTMAISGPSTVLENVMTTIEKYQITDAFMVPAILRIMVLHPAYSPARFTSLRTVVTGGDMVTKSTLDLIHRMFPNVQAYNGHGMSEGGNFLGWDFTEPMQYYGEIATLGTIRPGGILKIVDFDGNITERGEPGELHLDTKTTISHYLDGVNPETFYDDADGRWLKTGDIGLIDEDDRVYILGRSKDIIKRSGVPITPAALESCLQVFTNSEVAIIGVPHSLYGAEPFAVVVDLGGKTVEQLKQQVLDIFGKDYALGGVATLAQLGFKSMPLNATGKIQKLDLISALAAHPELTQ